MQTKLMEMVDFFPVRIILTAVELRMFEALADPQTASDLSAILGTDLRATERLMDALVALEVLQKENSQYHIISELKAALSLGPESVLPSLRHRMHLWNTWSKLTIKVREGQDASLPYDYEQGERPAEQVADFIGAMEIAARHQAGPTVDVLELDGVATLLDIGGGPAVYAEHFTRSHPEMSVWVLDLDEVCALAANRLESNPLAERINFIGGEARSVADEKVLDPVEGKGYDAVFMSNLIHSMSPEQIQQLLGRSLGWLAPGGQLIIKDFLLDESRTQPSGAAVFAINMLVNTPGGNSYTWSECRQWLSRAAAQLGREISVTELEMEDQRSGIIIATQK